MKQFGKEDLYDEVRKKGVLICAHRGTNGANVLQNTFMSAKNAMMHGADIFELDVILSKDLVFFAFHSGNEGGLLHMEKDISTMTSSEIDRAILYNSLNLPVASKIERLDFVLEKLHNKCYINIDRAWFYDEKIITYLNNCKYKNQIILKSPVDTAFLQLLEDYKSDVMYMPIIKSVDEFEIVQKYNVNLVAVELIFDTLEKDVVSSEFLQKMKELNIITWANMITLSDDIVLSAYLDDNNLIANGASGTLHKLQDMGFGIIQTDWPHLIKTNIKSI